MSRAGRAVLAALSAVAALFALAAPAAAAPQATAIRGGDTLYGSDGSMCVVGYNAQGGGTKYGILSPFCGSPTSWYADAAHTVYVGTSVGSGFPSGSGALVRYENSALSYPGEIDLGGGTYVDITGAANPHVGQHVCVAGRTTGLHCGTVTAVNVTISFPEGTLSGLFQTSVCAEPGDAGGPSFDGTTALGVVMGGSGSCSSGGSTFHQPVVEVLSMYGLSLY